MNRNVLDALRDIFQLHRPVADVHKSRPGEAIEEARLSFRGLVYTTILSKLRGYHEDHAQRAKKVSTNTKGGKMNPVRLSYIIPVADEQTRSLVRIVTVLAILLIGGASPVHAACGLRSLDRLMMSRSTLQTEPNAALREANAPRVALPSGQRTDLGAHEPIVGLWYINMKDSSGNIVDRIFSGWTGDGLEFDQDISPILTGYVCYGTWVKLEHNTYGLTHPFFTFMDVNSNGEGTETTEGQWDGNSAYLNYAVTVAEDGKSFTGKVLLKLVQGPNPYDPDAQVLFTATYTLSATKIEVNKTQLP